MGRSLDNAVLNLGAKEVYQEAIGKLGCSFEDLLEEERDAGLGNGVSSSTIARGPELTRDVAQGLGRLAACYMDSCVSMRAVARSKRELKRYYAGYPWHSRLGLRTSLRGSSDCTTAPRPPC